MGVLEPGVLPLHRPRAGRPARKVRLRLLPEAQADVFWRQDDVVLRSREESTNEEVITPSPGATWIATTTKAILVDDSQESFLIGTLRCRPALSPASSP